MTATAPAEGKQVLLQEPGDRYEKACDSRNLNQTRTDLLVLAALYQAAGVKDADYDLVVAVSGFGASFAYEPRKFFCMYQPPDSPEATDARLAAATGMKTQGTKVKTADEAWELLKASLDRGQAVRGRYMDDFLFTGYQDSADKQLRRVYHLGGWEAKGWWTWSQLEEYVTQFGDFKCITGPCARASLKVVAEGVIAGAVAYASGDGRKDVPWLKGTVTGLPAMEAYAADVADASKKPEAFDGAWLACHGISRQYTSRRCLAAFLRRAAGEFDESAKVHLEAAAKDYDAAYAAWQEYEQALHPDIRGKGEKTNELWSNPENREAGAAAVCNAIAHECRAVAELAQIHAVR